MKATREGHAVVFLNEQHSLLTSQEEALEERFEHWLIVDVPAGGWSRPEMDHELEKIEPFTAIVFGSPIPYMIGTAAATAKRQQTPVFILHNDRREAKEVVDRTTGQTKVIHTLAVNGWELVRVA
jgi:hypothetical protein